MTNPDSPMLNGRDAKGRFVAGNNGGPGRSARKREEQYLEVLLTTVPMADWRKIVLKAASQAKQGNYQARRWLTDYVIGPAAQSVHLRADLAGVDLITILREKLPSADREVLEGGAGWSVVDGKGPEDGS